MQQRLQAGKLFLGCAYLGHGGRKVALHTSFIAMQVAAANPITHTRPIIYVSESRILMRSIKTINFLNHPPTSKLYA